MNRKRLPWWIWLLCFAIFHVNTQLSLFYTATTGTTFFNFPVAFAIPMTLWWGPGVLVPLFLNATFSAPLFGASNPLLFPVYALPETLHVFLAWILVKERFHHDVWSPTPKGISLYTLYGIIIPSVLLALGVQGILLGAGTINRDQFLWTSVLNLIGNFMSSVIISLPLLILLTPWLESKKLSLFPAENVEMRWFFHLSRREKVVMFSLLAISLALSLKIPLSQSWYAYGIIVLFCASWYGLKTAILVNTWVAFLALALPLVLGNPWPQDFSAVQTPATLLTLCFSALMAGAAVSGLTEKIDRLRYTEQELKTAKETAEEASRAKSDFLARMSHEIRTPLNSVLGMLELLKETNLSKDQERYLTLFSHAGENLKALINDLLDFSKIEAKALTIENTTYNLHSTVRSVFEILQIKAEEKGLNFQLHIDDEVPLYQRGDPTRLRQVLFNLIGNALKFTEEGEVDIHVGVENNSTPENSLLVLEIRDTGIGIPRDKQSSLFSPFFQAEDTTTRRYGGTGLGLVISKNLVEIMGGRLELRSLAGRGTTFRISLPHRPESVATTEVKPTTAPNWAEQFKGRTFSLLLVDDSQDNRLLLTHYLKNQPFTFTEAVNGKEAVDIFKQGKFDFVFMDMQMPIMSGYKATELIRHYEKENRLGHTPIIALTATAVLEDLQRTLVAGCDMYMVKPVKKAEVLDTLSHILTTKLPTKEAPKERPPEPPSLNI
ncbi:ATP-binding protein [Bdellovibrio sp. HCB290]|uniref:ATP-binding protein n=1 Tax=Bdellovibrio sp. HCB290 TaxID=3394356 RepID=UPI0039B45E25